MPNIHYTRFPVTSTASWQQVVVMESRKRHDTTDFCLCQLVTDLSFILWTCYADVANLLRGNWCNGFWHLRNYSLTHQ